MRVLQPMAACLALQLRTYTREPVDRYQQSVVFSACYFTVCRRSPYSDFFEYPGGIGYVKIFVAVRRSQRARDCRYVQSSNGLSRISHTTTRQRYQNGGTLTLVEHTSKMIRAIKIHISSVPWCRQTRVPWLVPPLTLFPLVYGQPTMPNLNLVTRALGMGCGCTQRVPFAVPEHPETCAPGETAHLPPVRHLSDLRPVAARVAVERGSKLRDG